MGSRWIAAGMAAIAVAAGAAGCGSSSSDDDKPLTTAEFRAKANAICRSATARLGSVDPPRDRNDFRAWGKRLRQVQQARIDALAELEPPAELAATLAEFERGLETARDQIEPLAAKMAAGRGLATRLGSLGRANLEQLAKNARLAQELGLDDCQT